MGKDKKDRFKGAEREAGEAARTGDARQLGREKGVGEGGQTYA